MHSIVLETTEQVAAREEHTLAADHMKCLKVALKEVAQKGAKASLNSINWVLSANTARVLQHHFNRGRAHDAIRIAELHQTRILTLPKLLEALGENVPQTNVQVNLALSSPDPAAGEVDTLPAGMTDEILPGGPGNPVHPAGNGNGNDDGNGRQHPKGCTIHDFIKRERD